MCSSTLSLTSVPEGGLVVNASPRPPYPWERPFAHYTGGRVRKISPPPTGIRSPDPLARSKLLYQLRSPGPY